MHFMTKKAAGLKEEDPAVMHLSYSLKRSGTMTRYYPIYTSKIQITMTF